MWYDWLAEELKTLSFRPRRPKGDMRPVVQKITLSRLLILAWLMTWVTTAPLFDTHLPDLPDLPDTTDGQASLQGSLAHTVFSPDLPGEFSRSHNVTRHEHFFHVSNPGSNSPEVCIALLDDDDSKKRKVGQPSVLGVLCHLPNRPLLPNSAIESRAIHLSHLLFAAPQGPRAPPSVISL